MSNYEPGGESVSSAARFTVSAERAADRIGVAVGAGRVAVGVGFLAVPAVSVRILGVDASTARRMRFLARMTAARDVGLGVGTLAAGRGRPAGPWLLAGALA